jgi:hypothetical protein
MAATRLAMGATPPGVHVMAQEFHLLDAEDPFLPVDH